MEIKNPYISPETMERMWNFFSKTSIPRLVEKERNKQGVEKQKEANDEKSEE